LNAGAGITLAASPLAGGGAEGIAVDAARAAVLGVGMDVHAAVVAGGLRGGRAGDTGARGANLVVAAGMAAGTAIRRVVLQIHASVAAQCRPHRTERHAGPLGAMGAGSTDIAAGSAVEGIGQVIDALAAAVQLMHVVAAAGRVGGGIER